MPWLDASRRQRRPRASFAADHAPGPRPSAATAGRRSATFDAVAGAKACSRPLEAEQRAFILLKFRRTADAEPFARQAVGRAGARETRLRLAFADGFLAAGDRARALMIIEGMGAGEAAARQRIAAGKNGGQAIDSLPKAFGEVLAAFAGRSRAHAAGIAADRAGPGRALRQSAEQQRDDRCSRCCSAGRTATTKRLRCFARCRRATPLIAAGPRRPGADPARRQEATTRLTGLRRPRLRARTPTSAIFRASATCSRR